MKPQPPSALDPLERSPSALEHAAPAPPKEVRGGTAPPDRKHRGWVWIVVLSLVGLGAYFLWPKLTGKKSGAAASSAASKGAKGPPVTPVEAAKARKGDIGVYYNGLGSVTPIYTVTVKSRVDGELMNVRYKEGDTVHKGDLLVEIDPRPYQVQLEQAEGQMAKDQSTLANAKVDLARYETLLKQNAIPEQQLATQQSTVVLDEGAIKVDQGQIDAAKLNLVYCKINAPITGRVGLRLVDPGNIVHAADTNGLLVITQIQPISVIFTIAEDQLQAVLKRFNAGQSLKVDAYDRGMTRKITQGTLTTIDNQIDPTTATLKLRATFENKDMALFPNQFVNARLLVEEKHGATLVPTAGIQRNSQTTYVYLVKPDSTVTVRNITVGTAEGSDTEIVSGLAPGDVIVMTGVDKLQEGSKVKARLEGDKTQKGS
jgi:multidrug efflux system membrane fusion protein